MVGFTAEDLLIAELADLSVGVLLYFNSGTLFLCTCYFIWYHFKWGATDDAFHPLSDGTDG